MGISITYTSRSALIYIRPDGTAKASHRPGYFKTDSRTHVLRGGFHAAKRWCGEGESGIGENDVFKKKRLRALIVF